jgi:hypothetical protein
VVVGGNAPYLFNWSNGSFSKNQTNLPAGIYTLIVTDASQSTVSAEIELQQPNALDLDLIPELREGGYHISENGGSDGVIGTEVNGGVLPYTYLWSNNTTSNKISNEVAGTYSLVLTDMNGCTATSSATLTQPTELQILSISSPLQNGYNISCFEAKDGSIDLTVSGGTPPYEFQWSNGAFSEDLTELDPGIYWVIVRDANGAGEAAQIVLTGPAPLEASFNVSSYPNGKNVSCYGCSNGSITTTVSGGAPPYTFNWENGATTANLNNLGIGSYNLILTDANGCSMEERVDITGPDRDDWTMSGNAWTDPGLHYLGTSDNRDLVLRTNGSERVRIKSDGIVEFRKNTLKVDTLSADSLRSVFVDSQGILRVSGANQSLCTSPTNRWVTNYCGNANDIYNLPSSGNVGIGTSQIPAGYKLAVNGKIICEEVKVKLSTAWPDYVFREDHLRMPLSELKKFVYANRHLPGIPKAAEVEREGNNIGDMQAKLLEKIEELTLYIVEQEEKLQKLASENEVLGKRLDQISVKLAK